MAKKTRAKKTARPAAGKPAGVGIDEPAAKPVASAGANGNGTHDGSSEAAPLLCPWHKQPTVSYSTKGPFTYRRCPVKGCDFRAKVLRPGAGGILKRKLTGR